METGSADREKRPARVLDAVFLLAAAAAWAAPAVSVSGAGETLAAGSVDPGAAVFVPGDEAFLGGLVKDGVVTGCRWDGTRVGPRESLSTLACAGGATVRIRLVPLEDASPGDASTSLFAVGFEGDGTVPAGLREAFLARLGERAATFRWSSAGTSSDLATGPAERGSSPTTQGRRLLTPVGRALRSLGAAGALLAALGLLAAGAGLFVVRGRRPPPPAAS